MNDLLTIKNIRQFGFIYMRYHLVFFLWLYHLTQRALSFLFSLNFFAHDRGIRIFLHFWGPFHLWGFLQIFHLFKTFDIIAELRCPIDLIDRIFLFLDHWRWWFRSFLNTLFLVALHFLGTVYLFFFIQPLMTLPNIANSTLCALYPGVALP